MVRPQVLTEAVLAAVHVLLTFAFSLMITFEICADKSGWLPAFAAEQQSQTLAIPLQPVAHHLRARARLELARPCVAAARLDARGGA